MTSVWLQLCGGLPYFLAKVLFSQTERRDPGVQKKQLLILSWSVYLVGLPFFVVIFARQGNLIAAGIEVGALPSMVMGLVASVRGKGKIPIWLNLLAIICAVSAGILWSFSKNAGLTSNTQLLELCITATFILGTYFLAKQKAWGYLVFLPMHISGAMLMREKSDTLLMVLQLISLIFVTDAFIINRRRNQTT